MIYQGKGSSKIADILNKLLLQEEKAVDRISSLPEEVLGNILSFLPAKCAVRTSLLSSRWKYLFRLTTNLYFQDSCAIGDTRTEQRKLEKERFKKFVHLFLALHQKSTIKEFGLECRSIYDSSDLDVWISTAILKGVQELFLNLGLVDYSKDQRLPSSLFNSKSLQVLRIAANIDIDVPKTVCLPNLTILNLKLLKFVGAESINRFLYGCTSLQILTLEDCEFGVGNTCICSATLKYLTLQQIICSSEVITIDASSLRHLTITQLCGNCSWYAPTVKHLCLQEDTLRLAASCGIPVYPNLAVLELGWCPVYCWKDLIGFFNSSPRLETVIFRQGLIDYSDDEDQWEEQFRKLDVMVSSWSMHLEVIKIHSFYGSKQEFILLEYFLQVAKGLKWLTLYKGCKKMKMEDELKLAKDLLRLPRVSDYCRVELV